MHNSFLYCYLQFNILIAIGYIATRCMSKVPMIDTVTQYHKLKFIRFSFLIIISSFFIVAFIKAKIFICQNSTFHLEPILKIASDNLLQQHLNITSPQLIESSKTHFSVSFYSVLVAAIFIGVISCLLRYSRDLVKLNRMKQQSFKYRKIKNINLLLNSTIQIPFCWSFIKKHYVMIPNHLLENKIDLKLAIQHELQHIRQTDTYWLHFIAILKSVCFWNPFLNFWSNWMEEQQEFTCDEAIVVNKKRSNISYAQCLVNVANLSINNRINPQNVVGIHRLSKTILYRRVNMIFSYKKSNQKKLSIIFAYLLSLFVCMTAAYAFDDTASSTPLTAQEIKKMIHDSKLDSRFHIIATPEVVKQINNIRSSDQARTYMQNSLQRMKKYQDFVKDELKKNDMPTDLIAVPLVESGYQPLEEKINPLNAASIWQIVPATARRFGLVLDGERDDRFDMSLATTAALTYLNSTYKQFNDWKLAVIAYEIGENNTDQLIKLTGSHDAWALAHSSAAPDGLKKFIAQFDAAVIIMHNPSLVD